MKTIIETERLILREFVQEDYLSVFIFGSNKEVQKYTGDILLRSENEAKKIIQNIWFSDYKKYGYGRWAVVHKSDNKIIGFSGLKYLPEIDETDIGFRLLPKYWSLGIATESAIPILKYGLETLKLNRIVGIADPLNIASCKVLEKIGLTFFKFDFYDKIDNKKYNWYQIINSLE